MEDVIYFKDTVIEQKEKYIKELQVEINRLTYQETSNILLQIEKKNNFILYL